MVPSIAAGSGTEWFVYYGHLAASQAIRVSASLRPLVRHAEGCDR